MIKNKNSWGGYSSIYRKEASVRFVSEIGGDSYGC